MFKTVVVQGSLPGEQLSEPSAPYDISTRCQPEPAWYSDVVGPVIIYGVPGSGFESAVPKNPPINPSSRL